MSSGLGTLVLALLATWCISMLRYSGTSDPMWLVSEIGILAGWCCLVRLVLIPRFGDRFFSLHKNVSNAWVWGIGLVVVLTPYILLYHYL